MNKKCEIGKSPVSHFFLYLCTRRAQSSSIEMNKNQTSHYSFLTSYIYIPYHYYISTNWES